MLHREMLAIDTRPPAHYGKTANKVSQTEQNRTEPNRTGQSASQPANRPTNQPTDRPIKKEAGPPWHNALQDRHKQHSCASKTTHSQSGVLVLLVNFQEEEGLHIRLPRWAPSDALLTQEVMEKGKDAHLCFWKPKSFGKGRAGEMK